MRRRLHLRWCLALLGVSAFIALGTHFLHSLQANRAAGLLLHQAEKAEEDGNLQMAANYYARFLALEPKKADIRAKYGLLLASDELGKKPRDIKRAFLVVEQALRDGCEDVNVRRRLIKMAMQPAVDRYTDASEHIDVLFQAGVKDAELLGWRAECYEKLGEINKARACYEEAICQSDKREEHYLRLAELLRRQPTKAMRTEKTEKEVWQTADQHIENMLTEFKDSPSAFLMSAKYQRAFILSNDGDAAKVRIESDLAKALALAPTKAEVLLAMADFELERQQPKKARAYLEQGMELHPNNWQMYQSMARTEIADKRPESAVKVLEKGLVVDPKQIDLLWNLAELFIQQRRDSEAEVQMRILAKVGIPQQWLDYLQCRLMVNREQWSHAIELLQQTYPLLLAKSGQPNDWVTPSLAHECRFLLARCFESLGDFDRAAGAFGQIVAKAPLSVEGRLGLARMEWASGRTDFAIRQYRQLLTITSAPVAAWVEYVQLQLARNRQSLQPNWSEVLEPLEKLSAVKPLPMEAVLLRAELFTAKKQFANARAILEKEYPNPELRPVEVCIALSVLEERQGNPREALAILNEGEILHGDIVTLRMAKARYWGRQGGAEAGPALSMLERGIEKWSEADKNRLTNELASVYLGIGETKLAEVHWRKTADLQKENVGCRMMLFDLALDSEDDPAMRRLVEELKNIEDPDGTLWRYCEACRLILKSQKKKDDKALNETRALLTVIAARRSRWSRVTVAEGKLDEELGKSEQAIRKYKEAIELGSQDGFAIRRAVSLLSSRRRYLEVDKILQKIGERGVSLTGLDRVAAEIALAKADSGLALNLAQKAVTPLSKDYKDQIWLGQVYAAAGKLPEAEKALSKAIELDNTKSEAWVALVQFLYRSGNNSQAEAKLLEAHKKLSQEEALLPLAQCHEMIGQNDQAQKMYESALTAAPENPVILQDLALFHVRQKQLPQAQDYLHRIIDLKSESVTAKANARRVLAYVMTTSGDQIQIQEALKLMGIVDDVVRSEEPATDANLADERTKVFILARQSSPRQRLQAIAILEKIGRVQQLSAEERFLLAQLYDSAGQWPKAREQFMLVMGSSEAALQKTQKTQADQDGTFGTFVAKFCASLLRHDAVQEAQQWFGKLETTEPDSLRTLSIKAQLLAKQGRASEAAPFLVAAAQKKPEWVAPVAGLLEEIGQVKEAQQMYQSLVAQLQPKSPQSVLIMAGFLGRQNRPDEALAICETAWKNCKADVVASACLLVLYNAKCSPEQQQRVANWVERESAKKPKDTQLLSLVSAVRYVQKDYRTVVSVSRKILELDSTDIFTMNNLAWILALKDENPAEALKVINRAIAIKGAQPKLLDTRAVIFLKLGNVSQAVKDSEEAVGEEPASYHFFHLALAHLSADNRPAALAAFHRAKQLGLDEKTVDPLEHGAYQQLREKLDGR
jgi:cellulose synthase operon protein C